MATVADVITASLKELGVLASGEVPTAADQSDCLDGLNRLIDQWATERLAIYTINRTTWSIVSGTQTYTVGVGGTLNIAWPAYIEHVNFQDTSVTPTLERQLQPLTDDAWSKIPQRTLTSPFPTTWYFDGNYPLGNLSFWPVPTSSTLQGVIYAATAVPQFASTASTIALPPGYWRMLVKALAVEMAPAYDKGDSLEPGGQPGLLVRQALDAISAVKSSNSKPMDMSIDGGALVQGRSRRYYYSIFTG